MLKSVTAFEGPPSQYFQRELGIAEQGKLIDAQHLVEGSLSQGRRLVVVALNEAPSTDWIKSLPIDSLVVFLPIDERYNSQLTESWLIHPQVNCVFRAYPVRRTTVGRYSRTLFHGLVDVLSANRAEIYRHAPRKIVSGLLSARRQNEQLKNFQRLAKPVISYPLGYTNIFADALLRDAGQSNGSPSDSLFSVASDAGYLVNKRDHLIFFAGQTGQLQRRTAIDRLSKSDLGVVHQNVSFMAHPGDDSDERGDFYLKLLKSHQISLSPPGNLSGECFRAMESLIIGSLPLEIGWVLSDPGRQGWPWCGDTAPQFRTWVHAFKWVEEQTASSVNELMNFMRSCFIHEIEETRVKVGKATLIG